jgi:DNA-binding transcriptional LysR family regulator
MHLSDLNLNMLVHLDALLAEKNVSKAANRVCITQSAMSLALRRLREHFQDEILLKVGKTMAPTPLALSLAEPLRDVLNRIQSIVSSTGNFEPAKSNRKITITGADFTIDFLLKKVLPKLSRIAPGIRIEYVPLTGNRDEEFVQGRIDLLVTRDLAIIDGHPSEPLFTAKFACVVWSKNSLVRKELSFEQYTQLGHVCVRLGDWRIGDYRFQQHHPSIRRVEVVVPSFTLALQLVSGTQRIALCHLEHARMYAKQYSLRILTPPFDIPPAHFLLQWHKHMDHDPALIWFRGVLKEATRKSRFVETATPSTSLG